jgi:hypothetical protein
MGRFLVFSRNSPIFNWKFKKFRTQSVDKNGTRVLLSAHFFYTRYGFRDNWTKVSGKSAERCVHFLTCDISGSHGGVSKLRSSGTWCHVISQVYSIQRENESTSSSVSDIDSYVIIIKLLAHIVQTFPTLLRQWDIQTKLKTKIRGFIPQANIPTKRPPHVGRVSANFCGYRVSRGQHNLSPRPLISIF